MVPPRTKPRPWAGIRHRGTCMDDRGGCRCSVPRRDFKRGGNGTTEWRCNGYAYSNQHAARRSGADATGRGQSSDRSLLVPCRDGMAPLAKPVESDLPSCTILRNERGRRWEWRGLHQLRTIGGRCNSYRQVDVDPYRICASPSRSFCSISGNMASNLNSIYTS